MINKYVLVGQTPVPEEDLLAWASWFEECDSRRVALTRVMDMCNVSTIFLGLDHNFSRLGAPLLFETMAFWGNDPRHGWELRRCSTWAQAERQHVHVCRQVARPYAVLCWIGRVAGKAWDDACSDFRERWRELCQG